MSWLSIYNTESWNPAPVPYQDTPHVFPDLAGWCSCCHWKSCYLSFFVATNIIRSSSCISTIFRWCKSGHISVFFLSLLFQIGESPWKRSYVTVSPLKRWIGNVKFAVNISTNWQLQNGMKQGDGIIVKRSLWLFGNFL